MSRPQSPSRPHNTHGDSPTTHARNNTEDLTESGNTAPRRPSSSIYHLTGHGQQGDTALLSHTTGDGTSHVQGDCQQGASTNHLQGTHKQGDTNANLARGRVQGDCLPHPTGQQGDTRSSGLLGDRKQGDTLAEVRSDRKQGDTLVNVPSDRKQDISMPGSPRCRKPITVTIPMTRPVPLQRNTDFYKNWMAQNDCIRAAQGEEVKSGDERQDGGNYECRPTSRSTPHPPSSTHSDDASNFSYPVTAHMSFISDSSSSRGELRIPMTVCSPLLDLLQPATIQLPYQQSNRYEREKMGQSSYMQQNGTPRTDAKQSNKLQKNVRQGEEQGVKRLSLNMRQRYGLQSSEQQNNEQESNKEQCKESESNEQEQRKLKKRNEWQTDAYERIMRKYNVQQSRDPLYVGHPDNVLESDELESDEQLNRQAGQQLTGKWQSNKLHCNQWQDSEQQGSERPSGEWKVVEQESDETKVGESPSRIVEWHSSEDDWSSAELLLEETVPQQNVEKVVPVAHVAPKHLRKKCPNIRGPQKKATARQQPQVLQPHADIDSLLSAYEVYLGTDIQPLVAAHFVPPLVMKPQAPNPGAEHRFKEHLSKPSVVNSSTSTTTAAHLPLSPAGTIRAPDPDTEQRFKEHLSSVSVINSDASMAESVGLVLASMTKPQAQEPHTEQHFKENLSTQSVEHGGLSTTASAHPVSSPAMKPRSPDPDTEQRFKEHLPTQSVEDISLPTTTAGHPVLPTVLKPRASDFDTECSFKEYLARLCMGGDGDDKNGEMTEEDEGQENEAFGVADFVDHFLTSADVESIMNGQGQPLPPVATAIIRDEPVVVLKAPSKNNQHVWNADLDPRISYSLIHEQQHLMNARPQPSPSENQEFFTLQPLKHRPGTPRHNTNWQKTQRHPTEEEQQEWANQKEALRRWTNKNREQQVRTQQKVDQRSCTQETSKKRRSDGQKRSALVRSSYMSLDCLVDGQDTPMEYNKQYYWDSMVDNLQVHSDLETSDGGHHSSHSKRRSSQKLNNKQSPIANPSKKRLSRKKSTGKKTFVNQTERDIQMNEEETALRFAKSYIVKVIEKTIDRKLAGHWHQPLHKTSATTSESTVRLEDYCGKSKSALPHDELAINISRSSTAGQDDDDPPLSERDCIQQLKVLQSEHLKHISQDVESLRVLTGCLDDYNQIRTLYKSSSSRSTQMGD